MKIDGSGSRIYCANGYMQAVYLEAGQHKIEFRYWSRAAFVGMLVSCMTFLFIGAYFVVFVLRGKQRVIGAEGMTAQDISPMLITFVKSDCWFPKENNCKKNC